MHLTMQAISQLFDIQSVARSIELNLYGSTTGGYKDILLLATLSLSHSLGTGMQSLLRL
jgi:hypothetical protein